ncbi:MAG: SGNH/GDSL hydrolase family protein [Chloroflexi bacterium]|nr:SGNH/GDSL hydrolase family protein [Chloroflexota bacterium]
MAPLVVLIGDSIRMGYQEVVQRELKAVAEVWAPVENGGNSRNVLAHLDEWVISRQPQVVHLNCGLHDLRKEFDQEQAAVGIEEYAANVRQISTRVREQTDATLIWATTTPVNQAWHHATKGFDRLEADVRAYNQVAAAIATELGIPINDLYKVVMQAGRDSYLQPDGVHFSPAGYELLGQAVARAIAAHLAEPSQ